MTYYTVVFGKKSAIEIDSTIWREEICNRNQKVIVIEGNVCNDVAD